MTARFRVWLATSRTKPNWGSLEILETDQFADDGYDVVVEGDGQALREHIAAHQDIFMRCDRIDRPTREGFERYH